MATTTHNNGTVTQQGNNTTGSPTGDYVLISFPADPGPPPVPAQEIYYWKSQMNQAQWDLLVKAFDKELKADVTDDNTTNPNTVTDVTVHR